MDKPYHLKILVPAAAAGRIIGKGGSTIAQIQRDAGARVKMSKASEFYPGTTERVCLISGPIEGILKINDFFVENFASTSIKILVPNSTAGMIIGKGGAYIKRIKEESGAYVQISQKSSDIERCVTIIGELDNIKKACALVLNKIVEDSGTYRDIRTSSLSPMLTQLNGKPPTPEHMLSCSPNGLSSSNGCTAPTPTSSSAIAASVMSDMNSAQIIESIKLVLRVSGYGEDAVSEITSAMSTLASYGVLGVGLGLL